MSDQKTVGKTTGSQSSNTVSEDSKSLKDQEDIAPVKKIAFANLQSPKANKSNPRRSSILINRDQTAQLSKSPAKVVSFNIESNTSAPKKRFTTNATNKGTAFAKRSRFSINLDDT